MERVFDDQLRGQPGVKLVLVNNLNYRQREDIETPNEPGDDIYLTIDLALQHAAEKALADAQANVRGAVVVMDVAQRRHSGHGLRARLSTRTISCAGLTHGRSRTRLNDPKYTPQINRAIDGAYPPGSTFKIITAIACLESGLDPNEVFDSPGEYRASPKARPIGDTAGAGKFNFERAFYRSSNTYFIHLRHEGGLRKILEVAKRFHLGEKTGISTSARKWRAMFPAPEEAGVSMPLYQHAGCLHRPGNHGHAAANGRA